DWPWRSGCRPRRGWQGGKCSEGPHPLGTEVDTMGKRCLFWALASTVLTATLTWLLADTENVITGVVTDASRPVAGAVVRVQATAISCTANERGEFTLRSLPNLPVVALTAYAPGYYIVGPVTARPGDAGVSFALRKLPADDTPSYAWVSAMSAAGQDLNCQNCHADTKLKPPQLPFDEWQLDAHGTSAQNRRFLSMYNGTDLGGQNHSPLTRNVYNKDYGLIPLPPDPGLPYFGPGFKLDFPQSAGNCTACHTPAAAVTAPYDTDPNTVTGVGRESVACDFCHKVWSVRLDPSTGLPYPNSPGVLSFEFLRPPSGQQFFAGPYDDVAPGDDTYSPLQNQSQICAPCHFAKFWGTQIYNSFGEWLASPYSDPVKGQTCQDCHMPRRGAAVAARADKGAPTRNPKAVFSHLMPGAADRSLLASTAGLNVAVRQSGALVHVTASVVNERAGHHIPTDHPSRNILLVVSATDAGNHDLVSVAGPLVPAWGGSGSAPEDYGGKPGRGFAKILQELWTEVSPTAAYWNPTVLREDTRIPALGQDTSQYDFLAPAAGGPVQVTAKLVFRRAFRTLSTWKQWNDADIFMNQSSVSIETTAPSIAPLAVVHAATLRRDVPVAPESILTVYGSGLASSAVPGDTATGSKVSVRDRYGAEMQAQLLYVSPGQINLVLPGGLTPGAAVLKVMRDDQLAGAGQISLAPVAPGLFAANSFTAGPAAAVVVYVAADGSQTNSPTFVCSGPVGHCDTAPISATSETTRSYLMLFGTGFRGATPQVGVRISIGGIDVPVLSAGPQAQCPGLDQVNVELPAALAGRGEVPVVLSADGQTANTAVINIR
ncbi:MAG: carboxypeptidase regulatory-like domain-containing protein, partial [Tepidisphaerales bacterium]